MDIDDVVTYETYYDLVDHCKYGPIADVKTFCDVFKEENSSYKERNLIYDLFPTRIIGEDLYEKCKILLKCSEFHANFLTHPPLVLLIYQGEGYKYFYELLTLFLQYGADPLYVDTYSPSIYEGYVNKNSMQLAKRPRTREILETYVLLSSKELDQIVDIKLLDKTGTTDFTSEKVYELISVQEMTNLMVIAYFGYHGLLKKKLDDDKEVINLQDSYGNTALHYAIEYSKSLETIYLLIEAGADVYLHNKNGITPFDTLAIAVLHFGESPVLAIIIDILYRDSESYFSRICKDIINYLKIYL